MQFGNCQSKSISLKYVYITLLGLTAVTLSVKISELLKEDLDIKVSKEVCGSDSQVDLNYIKSKSRRFKTFLANRIQMIKDLSGVDQWHYMPTKSNPVDYISKGIDLTKLAKVKYSLKNPNYFGNQNQHDSSRVVY